MQETIRAAFMSGNSENLIDGLWVSAKALDTSEYGSMGGEAVGC